MGAQDYDELISQGTDLTGKIVIVRYGGLFRGLKVYCSISMYSINLNASFRR
jgi:hypothetical protein